MENPLKSIWNPKKSIEIHLDTFENPLKSIWNPEKSIEIHLESVEIH